MVNQTFYPLRNHPLRRAILVRMILAGEPHLQIDSWALVRMGRRVLSKYDPKGGPAFLTGDVVLSEACGGRWAVYSIRSGHIEELVWKGEMEGVEILC